MSRDTSPEAERVLIELLRKASPARKLEMVFDLNHALWQLVDSMLRMQHPGADARERQLRFAARWHDRDTMRKVFGWDPEGGSCSPKRSE